MHLNHANAAIKTVHVINSCHLDIGFASTAAGIVNEYFDRHLPRAVAIGAQMEHGSLPGYTDDKLNFMFHSWIIDVYLDCPSGMGLHCPDEQSIEAVKAAIKKQHITWHAFPHNAQLAIMGESFIEAGLELTHALDRAFGLPPKATVSQRDVPGMTRALVPLLARRGIKAISIGANGGSTQPALPACFTWHDRQSNTSLLGLFTWPGYGQLPLSSQKVCYAGEHALVYNFNGDNRGPHNAGTYAATWAQLSTVFPNATVLASTFDDFASAAVGAALPVVDAEVADTWVYGVPSDPQKVARMRAMGRAWAAHAAAHGGMSAALANDAVFRNATRFALKAGEHTWGLDVKNTLHDNADWLNADFRRAKRVGSANASQYAALESSWWEQRHWGITLAVDTLAAAGHPLARSVTQRFASLAAQAPDLSIYARGRTAHAYTCDGTTLAFDASGALSQLVDSRGYAWVDAAKPTLALQYRSYASADIQTFFNGYVQTNASWAHHDYGKPGLPSAAKGNLWRVQPSAQVWIKQGAATRSPTGSEDVCLFAVRSTFDPEASAEYGAPAVAWSIIEVQRDTLAVQVHLLEKTTTRLPEAMFVQFQVRDPTAAWAANKLGQWVTPAETVDGGSKHLHGVTERGLRVVVDGGRVMTIGATDAAVASFGALQAFPIPVDETPDTAADGSSFVLYDNLWGTNYVMWWPFIVPPPSPYEASATYFPEEGNANLLSRFTVELSS